MAERFLHFAALHKQQWNAIGMAGHFDDWPGSFQFNRDLVEALGRRGQARIFELAVNGEIVSLQFGFRLGDCFFWRLPARQTGKVWDRFGIGRVALIRMVEALIGEGVRLIEAGPGHYDYKIKQGGQELPLKRLILYRNKARSRLMTRAFVLFSDLSHLFYYRLWFQRCAPLLHMPRRPLLRAWIRSRS
jgi:CelD/BcsL family acetyltransferase involved in cellulose biosynthesis